MPSVTDADETPPTRHRPVRNRTVICSVGLGLAWFVTTKFVALTVSGSSIHGWVHPLFTLLFVVGTSVALYSFFSALGHVIDD
ncbi:hypothetical protein [Haladaptatus sp. NG-WS-4]